MRNLDLTPLWRSTVGFDRVFDLLNETLRAGKEDRYPPCNIERTGNDVYRISLALAGFGREDVTIMAEQNVLTVEGRKTATSDQQYIYQGISARPFRRQFNLADHVRVNGAWFQNGVLHIDLVREVPEAMKPRRITITSADHASASTPDEHVEQKQAA
jgi:molecular chaperone IbpA